jgi:Flp pilus assembly protein TadG
MRAATRCLRRIIGGLRDGRGVAAVEFALAAPLLAAILTVVVDFGFGFYEKMQVEDAAQAGAQYALLYGWNSTNVQNAVTGATSLSGITATPAPSQSCGCPSGTAVTATTCGSTCSNGLTAGTYVTVNAQATYTPLISYAVMGSSVTLSAQSVVRIQ